MRNLTYTLSPHSFAALTDPQKGVKGAHGLKVRSGIFNLTPEAFYVDGLIYTIRAVRFN